MPEHSGEAHQQVKGGGPLDEGADSRASGKVREATGAFGAHDEIALPVTGDGPFRNLGGTPLTAPQPRRFAIFAVVAMALLMSSLDLTIVATALHSIQHGLHSSINWTGWVITGYSVGLVLMLSLAGKLSDRFGLRRFFLFSVVLFAGSSLCCGLATSIYVLIALRVVQAAGGAGFIPSATAIVVEYFGSARDKAVGLFASIFSIGSIIGPIFGGLFVTYWTWRGIFFVNVPIGVVLILLCLRYVPRDTERTSQHRAMDLSGMALLGIGVLTLMIGISYLGEAGARVWSPLFIAPAAIGLLSLAQFGRHVRRVADPFIAPSLIFGRGFAAVNLINLLFGAVFGMLALVPLYAVNRYGISALGSGTLLTAQSVVVIVIGITAAMGLRRTGYRSPLYVSAGFIVAGLVMLAIRPPGLSAYLWLALGACVVGFGEGLASPASRNAGLQLAPQRSAALAALRSTSIQVGQITSVSIAAAILAHAYSPGQLQAKLYVGLALLQLLFVPVITRVPEHRGSW